MNSRNSTYIFILILIFQINCQSKSSDEEEIKRITAGLALSRLISGGTVATTTSTAVGITCSDSAPTFSTLSNAGVNTSCGLSGCHAGSSPQSGLDMTSYASALAKVSPKNGSGSLLFQKVNGGSMQVYTTSTITNAIYCWIQGGALP